MRPLTVSALAGLLALTAFAAAPPTPTPAAWLKLIDQLGSDDEDVVKAAQKKLADLGEDVIPALRKAAKTHADIDVRLRAGVVATAIEKALGAEVRRFTGHEVGHIA